MAHQRLTQVRSIISAIAAIALSVVLVATVGPTTAVADEKFNKATTQLPYNSDMTDDVHPEIGNIGPTTGRIGNTAVVSGMHFGDYLGKLTVGGVPAQIQQWSDTNISFTIPNGVTPGEQKVQVTDAQGNKSNPIVYSVLTDEQ